MRCRSFLESRRSFRSAPDSRQPCGAISCLNCRRRNFMAAKKKGSRKSGGRKYGQAASKSVKSAIDREKKGTLKSGRGGKGGHREEPQAGHRHRPLRSSQKRRQSSKEKESCLRAL